MSPLRPLLLLAPLIWLAASAGAGAEERPGAELFPQPMAVEHQLVDRQGDGTVFYGEPVRDTYGGSWIVSQRPDGSRLVIDLARREMTEIRPAEGLYWTIAFSRFAELRGRIAALEGFPLAARAKAGGPAAPPELELVELAGVAAKSAATAASREGAEPLPAALSAPGIRKFAIREAAAGAGPSPGGAAEVWVDPRFSIGAAAQEALGAFEADALGNAREQKADPARVLAAVRRHTGGALPVFTRLPVLRGNGEQVGESEDRVIAAVRLEAFPSELARVPEGLVRISHPLESIAAALEAQARVDAALAGREPPR